MRALNLGSGRSIERGRGEGDTGALFFSVTLAVQGLTAELGVDRDVPFMITPQLSKLCFKLFDMVSVQCNIRYNDHLIEYAGC